MKGQHNVPDEEPKERKEREKQDEYQKRRKTTVCMPCIGCVSFKPSSHGYIGAVCVAGVVRRLSRWGQLCAIVEAEEIFVLMPAFGHEFQALVETRC